MRLCLPAAILCIAPASAQRYLSVQQGPQRALHTVDTNAGVFYDFDVIDLTGTATPPPASVWDAARVEDEIWVTAPPNIYRYDATSMTFLGNITAVPTARGIDVSDGRVWVAAGDALYELSTDGTLQNIHPTTNSYDVLAWNGELLVSNPLDDTIDRYDLAGMFLGVFAGPGSPTGSAFQPGQLALRTSNGNLLTAGVVRVFEIDPGGAIIGDYQAGAFEQGVQEMGDGRLLVNLAAGAATFDTTTGIATPIPEATGHTMRFLAPFDAGDGSFERICHTSPNSFGPGARIAAMGSTSLAANDLRLEAFGAVPLEYSLFIYGASPSQLPWGDGLLCVSPFAPGLIRLMPGQFVTGTGQTQRLVDYDALPAMGTIVAGSTWSFQLLYRDPGFGAAGFNGSDGIRLTFGR